MVYLSFILTRLSWRATRYSSTYTTTIRTRWMPFCRCIRTSTSIQWVEHPCFHRVLWNIWKCLRSLSFSLHLSLSLSLPCIHPTLTCTHATGRLSKLPTARPDAHAHRQSQWRPASIRLRPRSRIAHHRDREDLLPAHEVRPGQKERGPHHLRI